VAQKESDLCGYPNGWHGWPTSESADERALGSRISMHMPVYRQMLMAIIMRPFPLF
jgi:hypothetical protein